VSIVSASLPMVLRFAVHGASEPSDAFSSFVSANYTPDADESPTTLTFTAKDAADDPIEGVSVTYA
jgi:hypothetical protein